MAYGNGFNNNGGGGRFPRNNNPRTGNMPQQEQTTGPVLYNHQNGKFLQFDYWGRYASIVIGTMSPGAQMTFENRRSANKVSQILSFGDLSDLQDVCEEVLESIKTSGTFTSTAVRVGSSGNALVEINNGSNIGQGPGIYLVIYKDLDQANHSNNMELYPFTSSTVLRGYDPSSGNAKEDIAKIGQFKKFYRLVREATKAFTMAMAHSVVVAEKPNRLTQFKALAAISQSMGVSISKELEAAISSSGSSGNGGGQRSGGGSWGNRGGGSYNGGNRGYGNRSYNGGSSYASNPGPAAGQPTMTNPAAPTLDDPIDITMSMNDLTNVDISQFK